MREKEIKESESGLEEGLICVAIVDEAVSANQESQLFTSTIKPRLRYCVTEYIRSSQLSARFKALESLKGPA